MTLPFFYSDDLNPDADKHVLQEEASKHIVQVLRMKVGDKLNLTNGKGYLFFTEIADNNKKRVALNILGKNYRETSTGKISIAISLVKNAARFEWFLEKATEIGVTVINPLICKRTEKQNFRTERMRNIMISAMLQSQQTWMPVLNEPEKFEKFIFQRSEEEKYIAHCEKEQSKQSLLSFCPFKNPLILVGPEGDFTNDEIELAVNNNYKAVSLGNTRLRTETAGVVALTLLNINVRLPG